MMYKLYVIERLLYPAGSNLKLTYTYWLTEDINTLDTFSGDSFARANELNVFTRRAENISDKIAFTRPEVNLPKMIFMSGRVAPAQIDAMSDTARNTAFLVDVYEKILYLIVNMKML